MEVKTMNAGLEDYDQTYGKIDGLLEYMPHRSLSLTLYLGERLATSYNTPQG